MTSCSTCSNFGSIHGMLVTHQGNFCDENCLTAFNKTIPILEGWDEKGGSMNKPADLVSRKQDKVFSEWEQTARGYV